MAMTGNFNADFTSFQAACNSAAVTLKGFEADSVKVGTQLQRMADSLSGTKIVQQATLAAEAVDRIGGTSKLTEAELQRVGAIASEAAEKLRAMGQDVPPGIQRIADESKNAAGAQRDLASWASSAAGAFVALFSVRAVATFVTDLFNDASALKDLSNQTHISTGDLQVLAGAMSEFGVDADTLGRSLYKLSRGIASGDDSVAHGLHLMGLSLKDVDGLQGEALFLKIEHGLSTLQGGLKDTAAAELFGGKLGAAMAGASDEIDEALAAWRRYNHVAGDETIDVLDRTGEAFARLTTGMKAFATDLIGGGVLAFETTSKAVTNGLSKWDLFKAMLSDVGKSMIGMGTIGADVATVIDTAAHSTEQAAAKTREHAAAQAAAAAATDTHAQAAKFLAALEADAAQALTSADQAALSRLDQIGQLTAKNAEGVGVSAAQFTKYMAERGKFHDAYLKWSAEEQAAEKAAADLEEKQHKAGLTAMDEVEKRRAANLEKRNAETISGADLERKATADLNDFIAKASLDSASYQILRIWEAADARVASFKGSAEQLERFTATVMDLAAREANAVTYEASKTIDTVTTKATGAMKAMELAIQQVEAGLAVDVVANAQAAGVGVGMQAPIYVSPGIYVSPSLYAATASTAAQRGIVLQPNEPKLGLAEGGIGNFGAGTPVTLHGREAVVPLDRGGLGTSVTVAPGAIVMNFPIVNNPQAIRALGDVLAEALASRLRMTGALTAPRV